MNFTSSDHKMDLYYEIFEIFSKGKKAFGTKDLGEVMQSYGMKPSELELQVRQSRAPCLFNHPNFPIPPPPPLGYDLRIGQQWNG